MKFEVVNLEIIKVILFGMKESGKASTLLVARFGSRLGTGSVTSGVLSSGRAGGLVGGLGFGASSCGTGGWA